MATFDFTPLYRSTVGFDRIPSLLSHLVEREEVAYPPYNIEKVGDDSYRIVMALAGFTKDDIEVVTDRNRLSVRGELKDKSNSTYLHRGFAQRSFERVFDLADYIEVVSANMAEGVLTIELKRELPESLKPRRIALGTATKLKAIESEQGKSAA